MNPGIPYNYFVRRLITYQITFYLFSRNGRRLENIGARPHVRQYPLNSRIEYVFVKRHVKRRFHDAFRSFRLRSTRSWWKDHEHLYPAGGCE